MRRKGRRRKEGKQVFEKGKREKGRKEEEEECEKGKRKEGIERVGMEERKGKVNKEGRGRENERWE